MITGHVFIATSLDGFIARKDHSLDWLPQEEADGEDSGYDTFVGSVDGLILGRGSFETVLGFGFWPYEKPVIVLSQSLTENDIPRELTSKVRLSSSSPTQIMKELELEKWQRAYIDGGQIVQSFLRENLIEDLIISTIPILIGEGIPLFGKLQRDIRLQLINSKTFSTGMIQNHYKILKN